MENDTQEALTYVSTKPDVLALKNAYDRTVNDLAWYLSSTRDSYDYRRNIWPNKAKDLRKWGPDAFPFEGASDTEVPLIDQFINTYVALCMSALSRANIRAYPVELGDLQRARVTSAFLKCPSAQRQNRVCYTVLAHFHTLLQFDIPHGGLTAAVQI